MTRRYTEAEAVSAVQRLTTARLRRFIRAECVRPASTPRGAAFTEADLARMELLCELAEDFDLDEEALGLVISLLDQLHGVRREFRALALAVADEPAEIRARIREAYHRAAGR